MRRKPVLIIALLALLSVTTLGQERRPRFKDYPVTSAYIGKAAPVDLRSDPNARTYRTRLREAANEKPNFARTQETEQISTIGGELRIVSSQAEGESVRYRVTLAGRQVFETNKATPAVHTYYKLPLYSSHNGRELFAEVLILTLQTNACEGGELLIVGIRRDGAFMRAENLIPCRSHIITWQFDRITISLQGNNSPKWIYENGALKEVRQVTRRPRK